MTHRTRMALAFLVLLACTACTRPQAGGRAEGASAPIPVVTSAVGRDSIAPEIEAVGTTRANESVEITSKAPNVVTAIRFQEGDEVARGEVLVEMDDAQARAALAEAQAALADSEAQFRRSRNLVTSQALSVADLEQIEARVKADEARVAAAQARLDDTVIRAPFVGRTGFRHVSVGSFVGAGTPITTLDDTSVIKLDFTVPENFLFLLRRGLAVTATSSGLPDRVFVGQVTNLESRVDPVTRSITARAEIPNADGALRQGMFMTVKLEGDARPALLVPEAAIVPEQGRTYAFVVNGNVIERREIHIGQRRPGEVEIVSGLIEGERVVVEGTQNIRAGSIVEESAPSTS